MSRPVRPTAAAPDLLDEWVEAGLLTREAASAIRRHEAAKAAGPQSSLVAEALGYLGAVVMLAGAAILAGLYWADLPVSARLVLTAGVALVLLGAGAAVPGRGGPAGRLRSVLWAGAVAATAGAAGVLATGVLDRHDGHALVVVGPVAALVASLAWSASSTWLQQLSLLVPLLLTAAGLALETTSAGSSWVGAAVWVVAVAWTGASWAGVLAPRVTGVPFGVPSAVLGAMTTDSDTGVALGLLTALGALVLALGERSAPWLAVAAVGLLLTTTRAATTWFPGRLSGALALLVAGAVAVSAAVWVTRRRGTGDVTATARDAGGDRTSPGSAEPPEPVHRVRRTGAWRAGPR